MPKPIMLTIGSLFSGVGGLELGLEMAGLGPVVWQVEREPFCRQVLAKHWPEADRMMTDVCRAGRDNLATVDLICGGFPCQDLSYAGKGAGLDGARSGLWFEYARIVGELRPRFVVVENVAALATRGLDIVLGTLADLGYDAIWTTLRASDVGAPHRRERLFIVAYARRGEQRRGGSGAVGGAPGTDEGQGDQRQRVRDSTGDCGETLAHSHGAGSGIVWQRGLLDGERTTCGHDADGCSGEGIVGDTAPRRIRRGRAQGNDGQPSLAGQDAMGDAACGGLEAVSIGGRPHAQGADRWLTQPRLGRAPDGLSARLDRWPAGPNKAQFAWEAPRTMSRCPARSHRLKALGNAVVPQVAEVVGWVVRGLMQSK